MDIFKLLVLIIVLLLLLQLLRQHSPAQGVLISAACSVLILLYALREATPLFEFAQKLSSMLENDYIFAVMKCIAIALIAQTTQELCRESGQIALAGQVELCGRVAIMICALPLFTQLLNILSRLL